MSLKAYVGTKIILARPQISDGGEDGYMVIYPDGYVSWSPKGVFEEAYRRISEFERELIQEPVMEEKGE